jgi:hypothetical protein
MIYANEYLRIVKARIMFGCGMAAIASPVSRHERKLGETCRTH